ncbi:MAG TPA: hypothetical protein VFX85_00730, partial [Solirubrobacterales bacterium]|nr:hypothetical protein [Solirubrobacterales bacterium]
MDELVVDNAHNTYVTRGARNGIEKFSPGGTLLYSLPFSNVGGLAIDQASGNLLASHVEGLRPVVVVLDSSGNPVRRFGYGLIQGVLSSLAVGQSALGDVYGIEPSANRIRYLVFPPPGPIACCVTIAPGNTKATLKGQVNPEGKASTYHFEYLTESEFIANGSSFSGPNVPVSTPESSPIGPDFVLHEAIAQIGCTSPTDPPQPECLDPETKYHVRIVAENPDGDSVSPAAIFETRESLELKATWATDVGPSSAELHAEVNPLGIPATGFFEYVDDASFQASGFDQASKVPATPIDLGVGEDFVTASTQISSLEPNTLYHYRVVASNAFVGDVSGGVESFLTFPASGGIPPCPNDIFRIGTAEKLPDCRAYEMVSPVDKNGGDIKVLVQVLSHPARLDQSSGSGDAFTYSSVAAFAEPQSALWSNQYLARRGAAGWENEPINWPKEPTNLTDNPILKLDAQYRIFDSDLSSGWVSQYAGPPLDDCAPEGFINLYRRDNNSGSYEALVIDQPAESITAASDYRIELQGLSADGSDAVFRANAKLMPTASNVKGIYQLYMHTRDPEGECGQLRLISVKPNGTAVTENASAGSAGGVAEYRRSTVARAVSLDGNRVFFSSTPIPIGNGPLFVRVNTDLPQGPTPGGKCATPVTLGCTLEISADPAQFWTAATDGSRVVYSVGGNLFEYDVDKAMAGQSAVTQIAGGAKGVVGASEDASRIYFTSTEQIEGEGVVGKPNLFLYEPGKAEEYRLVATLSERDLQVFNFFGLAVGHPTPIPNGVRLSADGSHLAFVSQASLTGYDNLDAITGEPAIEVYLYDTTSAQVRCISCNPSGSRPEGREFKEGSTIRYVAAMMAPGESQTFTPRSLSADGNRLFFESFDALLPSDVNKAMDVYEWQRAGSAEACNAMGMELYVPASGGCLALISSGTEETDSEFADASPDGSDVFIRTLSSLVPQDPGQIDVYDVREGGGFPVPSPPRPACEGEACVGPAPGPPADT